MSERLRCHMFIGIPASGKSTLANELAPLINAEILSTDKIREELYGDETVQGSWNKVCLLYTSPSPRDNGRSRMPSSA